METDPTFGPWLKLWRRALGLTQARFGQLVGYAAETIRTVEADELRPSRQMVEKLAGALAIPLDQRERSVRFARDEMVVAIASLPQPAPYLPPLPEGERDHAPEDRVVAPIWSPCPNKRVGKGEGRAANQPGLFRLPTAEVAWVRRRKCSPLLSRNGFFLLDVDLPSGRGQPFGLECYQQDIRAALLAQ